MVSYRAKKKLACETSFHADRTCMYCEKEFRYPYLFLRHKSTKCWINGESTLKDCRSTLGRVEFIKNSVESTFGRVGPTFEKNTVPIRLFLAPPQSQISG